MTARTRTAANCLNAAMARPLFQNETRALLERHIAAEHAARMANDAQFNHANDAAYDASAALINHIGDKLGLTRSELRLLSEALA